jgi:hypothetical protein
MLGGFGRIYILLLSMYSSPVRHHRQWSQVGVISTNKRSVA